MEGAPAGRVAPRASVPAEPAAVPQAAAGGATSDTVAERPRFRKALHSDQGEPGGQGPAGPVGSKDDARRPARRQTSQARAPGSRRLERLLRIPHLPYPDFPAKSQT
jgi:hypothetical protein